MSSFKLLNDKIKKYVWDQNWGKFRPIQEAAINHITNSNDNYILAAKTASGKTEAAFLPSINLIKQWEGSVKILYISPLIALINDQFVRIEKLCDYLDVKVTKWHGEAKRSDKQKLISNPEGILLITPESIEAMYSNHPEYIRSLFNNLDFIIIDEIHSFLGTSRGKHLQSLIHRIQSINSNNIRLIGLSATLSKESYNLAKDFFHNGNKTNVLLDQSKNETSISVKYFPTETPALPIELIQDIYFKTQTKKSLIFPNTRGRVEELAVKLKRFSEKKNGAHKNYFSHHSSVDKELRTFVEKFAKSSYTQNFAISCTSTLELGIDIGSIDTVVQVDSTYSVSSLVQRLGRSGRKTLKSNLLLYATNEWSLLQSIACIELYKESFIEPISDITYPYDVALQQILSIVKEHNGISQIKLIATIRNNKTFTNITNAELTLLINDLINKDIIENLSNELIIGIEGEKIVNKRDFYSLFDTEDNFKVEFKGKNIGEMPLSPQIIPNENIFLSAQIWEIKEVDTKIKKIFVVPAKDGKKPKFFGSGGQVHKRVREKMLDILLSDYQLIYLDNNAQMVVKDLRKKFVQFKEKSSNTYRPILITETKQNWYSFSSTKINRTINLLLNIKGYTDTFYYESETHFESYNNLTKKIKSLIETKIIESDVLLYLKKELETKESSFKLGKFVKLLPTELKVAYLYKNHFDLTATNSFLANLVIEK